MRPNNRTPIGILFGLISAVLTVWLIVIMSSDHSLHRYSAMALAGLCSFAAAYLQSKWWLVVPCVYAIIYICWIVYRFTHLSDIG